MSNYECPLFKKLFKSCPFRKKKSSVKKNLDGETSVTENLDSEMKEGVRETVFEDRDSVNAADSAAIDSKEEEVEEKTPKDEE